MATVDWSDSPLTTLRDGIVDIIGDATAGDYQLSLTWENLSSPAVVIIGAGWTGETAKGVNYKLDIYTLYDSQDSNPEAGAEEMMRRVWVSLAYATSEDEHVELSEVTAVEIILGTGEQAVRYAGHQCQIKASLDLSPVVEE